MVQNLAACGILENFKNIAHCIYLKFSLKPYNLYKQRVSVPEQITPSPEYPV